MQANVYMTKKRTKYTITTKNGQYTRQEHPHTPTPHAHCVCYFMARKGFQNNGSSVCIVVWHTAIQTGPTKSQKSTLIFAHNNRKNERK